MKAKGLISVLCIACFFCSILSAYAADPIKGNGKIVTKTITLSDYNEIRVQTGMEFNFEQSESTPSLEITIDENLYPYLKTGIKDRILTLEFKGAKVESYTQFVVKANSKWLKEARVTGNAAFNVNTPLTGDEISIRANSNCLVQLLHPVRAGNLELKINQSANIVAEKIEAEKITCDMDGSGSIRIKGGDATEGLYSITGSSDLHAFGFEVARLNCKMTGSGLAEINTTEDLKVSMVGKGTIRYKGIGPNKQVQIGKGTIEKAE